MNTATLSPPSTSKPHSTRLASTFSGYSDPPRPLGEYSALLGIYAVLLGTALLVWQKRNAKLPGRLSEKELVLMGVATHKLSRLIALDAVTSPIRAPFTRFQKTVGESEVSELPRGEGMRRVVGELLSCPYCLGVWVASALSLGSLAAPRFTRFMSGIFFMTALSDFLHRGFVATKKLD